jgi:PKD repeat protein
VAAFSTASAVLAASLVFGASAALADTAPVNPQDPATPPTVSADALPTVQVDGVVWKQAVIGNTVYAVGKFTKARPAGAAPGTNEVTRNNILAYDIRTGNLITTFNADLNAQAVSIEAAPDGSRIYVGGSFTQVNGATRHYLAALNPATGAAITSFTPWVNSRVTAIAATNSTVYLGGWFSGVGSVARNKLAAVQANNAALLPWAPQPAGGDVNAMALAPDASKVVVGGSFTTMNGSSNPGYGLAAVDTGQGNLVPWAANNLIRNGGTQGAILSMDSDGTNVYGTGYTFGRAGGTLEGTFSANWEDGTIKWIEDCHGDTYGVYAAQNAVYTVSHAHYCGNIGGFPQTEPDWSYRHALAFSKAATGTITREVYNYTNFAGNPSPSILHWFPELTVGTVTGQDQAAWAAAGNDDYVVLGGEFPRVNGAAQQGLVRFAVRPLAPNQRGPVDAGAALNPTVFSPADGTVRVNWRANWDMDNANLKYELIRDGDTGHPIYTEERASTFWNRPSMGFTDKGLQAGRTYTYRLFVRDSLNNIARSETVSVTVASGAALNGYVSEVWENQASNYWRLDEATGTAAADSAGNLPLLTGAGVGWGATGALQGDSNTAADFNGTSTGVARTQTLISGPNTFTLQAWFKTTTVLGGKIVGFGNSTLNSSSYDRHIYMDNLGRIWFGVRPYGVRTTLNTTQPYNDGNWHQVTATLGAGGMVLYIDGQKVGERTDATSGQVFFGYWKVGGDNLNNWPSVPLSRYFNGSIDEVAVYPSVLSEQEVQNHFEWSQGAGNVSPAASFTNSVADLQASFDASASADPDGSITDYTWDFGDGSPAGSGVSTAHTYNAAGTYQVQLTVTDNKGATGTTTKAVTVAAANQPPSASFTASASNLTVALDGSASSDPDGNLVSYSWDFGDGTSPGTGATTSHTYAVGGTYTVTLRVTDNRGATAETSREITVSPAQVGLIAQDDFARTVASGFGTADIGGPWSVTAAAGTSYSVSNGVGRMTTNAAGQGTALLNSVSSQSTDVTVRVAVDKRADGGGYYVSLLGRKLAGNNDYRAKLWISSSGQVTLYLVRVVNGAETTMASKVLTPASFPAFVGGDQLQMRLQVTGVSPTTLNAKVWKAGAAEPAAWDLTTTNSEGALQGNGSLGLLVYLSRTATTGPSTASFSSFVARQVP